MQVRGLGDGRAAREPRHLADGGREGVEDLFISGREGSGQASGGSRWLRVVGRAGGDGRAVGGPEGRVRGGGSQDGCERRSYGLLANQKSDAISCQENTQIP